MIPEERLQQLIKDKDTAEALRWCKQHQYVESWLIMDGCLIIYNVEDPPEWLKPVLETRDDDGNTPSFYETHPDEGEWHRDGEEKAA